MITLAQAWRLADVWYTDRLRPDWRPRSTEERQQALTSIGLTGPAWEFG